MTPKKAVKITRFPFEVGRDPSGLSVVQLPDFGVSRSQFALMKIMGQVYYVNRSQHNPATVDGVEVGGKVKLAPGIHIVKIGFTTIGIGTDYKELCSIISQQTTEYYMARARGMELGPWTGQQLLEACKNGVLGRDSKVWYAYDPNTLYSAEEIVEFDRGDSKTETVARQTSESRFHTVDEGATVEIGENFKCPYCRAVCDIGDVLSVSVSSSLMGDVVLGPDEQSRFAPTNFTDNGLAIDSEGGICTDIACPCCHMSLPQDLLSMEQIVMSVVGAAGAGKSVFLASSIWQSRQFLKSKFGVGFRDLAPAWNIWIRAYEERFFFQQDGTKLQQIEKTELQASNISRSVNLAGESVLLPMPSYFRVGGGEINAGPERCLTIYDCAGEHFKPGADTHTSLVTLHSLSADAILFLFDPSADPRMQPLLDRGSGTAANSAQMQDVLLAELAARARRHMGNRGSGKLTQPLLFAISKSDMLRDEIPMAADLYKPCEDGKMALDVEALKVMSRTTEGFLDRIAPEVSAMAHDISDDVWFVPVSALGHNPMREGVRPCDIKPVWAELPVVFTLAKKGMIKTVNGTL